MKHESKVRGLAFLLGLFVVPSAAIGQRQPQPSQLERWLQRYPEADADKDGTLSRQEALNYRRQLVKQRRSGTKTRVEPTVADLRYGNHPRNLFDLWLPERTKSGNDQTFPLLVYFHGGGFVAGDKSSFDPSSFLSDGIAVVSANYRFVDGDQVLAPAPLLDAARVIQFVRQHADQWNIDCDRIAVSGSSAGAVITMWIGYHNDLANPASDDPVAQQSTRVRCIAPINGPSNLDPRWITRNMGGPKQIHGSYPKMYGVPVSQMDRPAIRRRILESSPIEHVSADDPPSLLIYTGTLDGIPLAESATTGQLIHHAFFGKTLKQQLDQFGVENRFLPATDPRKNGFQVIRQWLAEYGFDD